MEELFQDLSNNLTLKDKAYLSVRELIISGKIKPGTRLPEEELSKQMNISRAPIREALNMLEREGFTAIIPRRGAIVTEVTWELVQDVWEMRVLLEPYAARASIHMITDAEIDQIDCLVQRTIKHPDDINSYIECDLQLHALLNKHVSNRYLKDYISTTASHSLRVRYVSEYNSNLSSGAVRDVYQEHTAIIAALRARDGDRLYSNVLQHISNSLRRCQQALEGENIK